MPKSLSDIESSPFNKSSLMHSNFNKSNTNSNNKYIMSPPLPPVGHQHHNSSDITANDFKPSLAYLNSNLSQRFFNNSNNSNSSQDSNQINHHNQRLIANHLISEIQSQIQHQQQNNNFNLHQQQQQQQMHNMHNQQHFTSNNIFGQVNTSNNSNFLDTNNNNILFNKTLNNLATSSSQLNKNIGGVINNLINSTLTHHQVQNTQNFLLNNSTTNNNNNTAPNANLILNNALNNFSSMNNNNLNPNNSYVDESKCHVCGDKSTGSHFGGISCESCKAFFRRSVQRNRFEDYKCSYSGECKMNTNTRKICQFCRYKQCLSIGMRPKWVLSDDERHQKYGSRRKNKTKLEQTTLTSNKIETSSIEKKESSNSIASLTANTSSTSLDLQMNTNKNESVYNNNNSPLSRTINFNNSNEISSSTNSENDGSPQQTSRDSSVTNQNTANINEDSNSARLNLNKSGIDGIDMNNLILNSFEKDLIDRLSIAFYHSRKYNAVDLNVQKKLAVLFQTQNDGSLKKMSKVILANFIVQPVKRVITFAKLLHDFRKLDISDQMSLLQGGAMEIFICSSSSLYDQMANKLVNVVSKDRNIDGNDNSNVQLDILRLIWSENIFEKTIHFFKSMSELKLDEATLILFLPLILFSPDRRDLDDRKRVYQIQSKYSFLLKKYMIWKFGFNGSTIKLYNKLLLKLMELRTLQEMHSSILLDADPSRLEPFSLALITSHKEENSKFKSNDTKQLNENQDNDHIIIDNDHTTDHNGINNFDEDKQEVTIVDETSSVKNTHNNNSINSVQQQNDSNNSKPNSNYQLNSFSDLSVLTPVSMTSSVNCSGQISSISSVSSQTLNQHSPPHSNENNFDAADCS